MFSLSLIAFFIFGFSAFSAATRSVIIFFRSVFEKKSLSYNFFIFFAFAVSSISIYRAPFCYIISLKVYHNITKNAIGIIKNRLIMPNFDFQTCKNYKCFSIKLSITRFTETPLCSAAFFTF